jgi:hypothetical protein
MHHIDLVPIVLPSPVSRFLNAGSVIPVASIPTARISIDPPSGVPRARSLDRKPLHICGSRSSILSAGHSTKRGRRSG